MKKTVFFICCFFILIFTKISWAESDICTNLYSKLPENLKQAVPELTWVDVNPTHLNSLCNFVIRYYPCNALIQHHIDKTLPNAITRSAKHCSYVSQGEHKPTEGYCTLQDVKAECW